MESVEEERGRWRRGRRDAVEEVTGWE